MGSSIFGEPNILASHSTACRTTKESATEFGVEMKVDWVQNYFPKVQDINNLEFL